MRKLHAVVLLALILSATSGCANGPIRKFFSGAECSTCRPPFGGLFQRSNNTVGTCSSGTCGVTPIDGSMMGGESFGNGYLGDPNAQPPLPGATIQPGTVGDTYPYPGTTNNSGYGNPGLSGFVNPPTGIVPGTGNGQ